MQSNLKKIQRFFLNYIQFIIIIIFFSIFVELLCRLSAIAAKMWSNSNKVFRKILEIFFRQGSSKPLNLSFLSMKDFFLWVNNGLQFLSD